MGIGDAGYPCCRERQFEETTTADAGSALVDEESELISLYYGEEVNEEDAKRFVAEIEE